MHTHAELKERYSRVRGNYISLLNIVYDIMENEITYSHQQSKTCTSDTGLMLKQRQSQSGIGEVSGINVKYVMKLMNDGNYRHSFYIRVRSSVIEHTEQYSICDVDDEKQDSFYEIATYYFNSTEKVLDINEIRKLKSLMKEEGPMAYGLLQNGTLHISSNQSYNDEETPVDCTELFSAINDSTSDSAFNMALQYSYDELYRMSIYTLPGWSGTHIGTVKFLYISMRVSMWVLENNEPVSLAGFLNNYNEELKRIVE